MAENRQLPDPSTYKSSKVLSIGTLIVSILNITAIASASTIHIDYLLCMKVGALAGTHEEQLIGKRLINTK